MTASALCLGLPFAGAAALGAAAPLRAMPDATLPIAAGTPIAPSDASLLAVRINGVAQSGDVLALPLPGGGLAVPLDALEAWRLRMAPGRALRTEGRDYADIGAIAGLAWRIDGATQTLMIEAPASAFLRSDFEVVSQPMPVQAQSAFGGYLNYDLHWERDGSTAGAPDTQNFSGLVEAGLFSRAGNGRSTGLWHSGSGNSSYTRLDTQWNIDRPAAMSSLRFGDAISTPGAWGRSVRFGGLQWATNFAVQPGFVSFPMPAMRGEAAVPSVVDLYVNNTHQLQGNVPPGPFDLPDVPVVTGQGQIKMVVRDLLGREQVVVQPYYVTPSLLRPGLHDFAVETGFVRDDYGLASFDYGRALVNLTDRTGVTPTFTREFHAELLRDQQTVGASGAWLIRDMATASLSAAASHGPHGAGWLLSGSVDRQAQGWSANLQGSVDSRDFVQIGQAGLAGTGTPRNQITAGLATTLAGGGAGVNLVQQESWQGDRFRSASLTYSRSLGPLGYISVYASRSAGSASGTTIGLNLIRPLDATDSVSLGTSRSRDRTYGPPASTQQMQQNVVQLQSSPPPGPGVGYQVLAENGSYQRLNADATWQGERVAVEAGVAHTQSGDAVRAGVSGGMALMPEGVFLSRRIDGSFAVVQVGDYAGVRIDRDNQFVARTDAQGRAFVAGLRGFESNRISVEEGDLPLDAEVDHLHIAVSPGMGSGVSVRFPVRRTRTATFRLVTDDGQPVPPGSRVRIDSDEREFPVGFDGQVFLAGLAAESHLVASWPDHDCRATVVLRPDPDDVPDLGTLACR